MSPSPDNRLNGIDRLWNAGQRHLAGLRYVAARTALERAEAAAWRGRDARTLARIYLPLLEVRRQIRYQAAEGVLVICGERMSARDQRRALREFLKKPAGTILLACAATAAGKRAACLSVQSVRYEARRSGRWLEALLLIERAGEVRIATPADARFAAGLAVSWTRDPAAVIGASTNENLFVPLPPPGRYVAGELHALARESLIVGWEALALKWQQHHTPRGGAGRGISAWEELAWLRRALKVDPACEPAAMRLIKAAEGIERNSKF